MQQTQEIERETESNAARYIERETESTTAEARERNR